MTFGDHRASVTLWWTHISGTAPLFLFTHVVLPSDWVRGGCHAGGILAQGEKMAFPGSAANCSGSAGWLLLLCGSSTLHGALRPYFRTRAARACESTTVRHQTTSTLSSAVQPVEELHEAVVSRRPFHSLADRVVGDMTVDTFRELVQWHGPSPMIAPVILLLALWPPTVAGSQPSPCRGPCQCYLRGQGRTLSRGCTLERVSCGGAVS